MALTLTADERTELERRSRSLMVRAEDARRAQVAAGVFGVSRTASASAALCHLSKKSCNRRQDVMRT